MKKENYNISLLRDFIVKSKTNKYLYYMQAEKNVNPKEIVHKSYRFEDDGFTLEDNYIVNLPYSGQETIRFQSKPIWILNYYGGKVLDSALVQSAEILQMSRMQVLAFNQDTALNGMIQHVIENNRYTLEQHGDYTAFNGKGFLLRNDVLIFETIYHGGLVSS